MGVIGRAFLILFALCCSFAVCAMMLGVAALIEPGFGRMAAFAIRSFVEYAFSFAFTQDNPAAAMDLLARLWTVMAVLMAGPVTLMGLIGEVVRIRSFVWYSGATGVATAALPWLARTGYGDGAYGGDWGEGRVTLALFLCGAMAGLAYWLIAGRSAGGDTVAGPSSLPGQQEPEAERGSRSSA